MMFSFSDISYQLTYAIQDIEKIDQFFKPRRLAEERMSLCEIWRQTGNLSWVRIHIWINIR